MLYGEYTFLCQFDQGAVLPAYKGSTFRGVFGTALKRVVCALKQQTCSSCLLRERCIYTNIFETSLNVPPSGAVPVSSPPHPFVIEPPQEERTTYEPGDIFACTLLLFGEAVPNLPYFIYAIHEMAEMGIGKRINGRRGRFHLETVSAGEKLVYSKNDATIRQEGTFKDIPFDALYRQDTTPFRDVEITMETPLRLKRHNRFSGRLTYDVLIRAVLRRISSLFATHGEGDPPLDYTGLVNKSKQVAMLESRVRWFDWTRYSGRQDRRMNMGGMIGSVRYQDVPAEFLPLLELGARFHLGKATSFGLGKVKVNTQEVRPSRVPSPGRAVEIC